MVKRTSKRRLDAELVRQGLFPDTKTALRSILAGDVSTHDRRLSFAGEPVEEGIFLHVPRLCHCTPAWAKEWDSLIPAL